MVQAAEAYRPCFNAGRDACLPRPERFQEHDAGSNWFRLLEHPDPASMPVGTLVFRGLNDFRNMMPNRIQPKWFRLPEQPDPASIPVGALVFRGLNDFRNKMPDRIGSGC